MTKEDQQQVKTPTDDEFVVQVPTLAEILERSAQTKETGHLTTTIETVECDSCGKAIDCDADTTYWSESCDYAWCQRCMDKEAARVAALTGEEMCQWLLDEGVPESLTSDRIFTILRQQTAFATAPTIPLVPSLSIATPEMRGPDWDGATPVDEVKTLLLVTAPAGGE